MQAPPPSSHSSACPPACEWSSHPRTEVSTDSKDKDDLGDKRMEKIYMSSPSHCRSAPLCLTMLPRPLAPCQLPCQSPTWDRPFLRLINNPKSVLTLRRQHPHQPFSQGGSSNYSNYSDQGSLGGSLGRGQGQWTPPWHEAGSVARVRHL